MTKHNFLGFGSIDDFISSFFGFKTYLINAIPAIALALTTFITGYIYDTASAVYLLWFLMICDWTTGIWKSINAKVFVSYKILRMPIYFVATSLVLSLGWQMAQNSVLFIWLPGLIIGGLYSVFFISIIENLGQLGFLPKSIVALLKKRVGLKTLFDSDKKKEDDEKKDQFI